MLSGSTDGIIGVSGPYNLEMVESGENPQPSADGMCELCGRRVRADRLTRHHLLPRSRARRMKRRRRGRQELDRKSTRLNSSHANISYAVFCLKKKTRTSPLPSRIP